MWRLRSVVELRREFVCLALQEGSNVSDLCRRFGISRKTGYKWLGRGGEEGGPLSGRPRGPNKSPKGRGGAGGAERGGGGGGGQDLLASGRASGLGGAQTASPAGGYGGGGLPAHSTITQI